MEAGCGSISSRYNLGLGPSTPDKTHSMKWHIDPKKLCANNFLVFKLWERNWYSIGFSSVNGNDTKCTYNYPGQCEYDYDDDNMGTLSFYSKARFQLTRGIFVVRIFSATKSASSRGPRLICHILYVSHDSYYMVHMIKVMIIWSPYNCIENDGSVGQRWYSFGWESQTLETVFLSIWMVPLWSLDQFSPTPFFLSFFGNKWLIFRIMIGAGLIKIRGDSCWRDLTCMNYHYQDLES